jgi:hypothetical protein
LYGMPPAYFYAHRSSSRGDQIVNIGRTPALYICRRHRIRRCFSGSCKDTWISRCKWTTRSFHRSERSRELRPFSIRRCVRRLPLARARFFLWSAGEATLVTAAFCGASACSACYSTRSSSEWHAPVCRWYGCVDFVSHWLCMCHAHDAIPVGRRSGARGGGGSAAN